MSTAGSRGTWRRPVVDTLTRDDTLHRMEQATRAPVAHADADTRRAKMVRDVLRHMEDECEDINVACGFSLLLHADDATLAKMGRMLK